MKNLLFIIVLFFSTSVLAGGKWIQIPFSLTDLLDEGFKVIDQYSDDISRNYLLQKKNQRIILCSYNLGRPFYTWCYVEEVNE